jgi:hypothetical protein
VEVGSAEMREPIRKMLSDQISRAIEVRDQTCYQRSMQGLPPLDVTACLGPGRCMFPRQGSDARVCPFCLKFPSGRGSSKDAASVIDRFVKGN